MTRIDLRPILPAQAMVRVELMKTTTGCRRGSAHGYLSLKGDLLPGIEFTLPAYGRGVRWDDPAFGISCGRPRFVVP